VEGGMGSVSKCLAANTKSFGDQIDIFLNQEVAEIKLADDSNGGLATKGVLLKDGKFIEAKTVLSNCTPHVTFNKLLANYNLNQHKDKKVSNFFKRVQNLNYDSGTMKINLAVNGLPNFKVLVLF
jgi:phytoene dehydrogenase-like protein